MLDRNQNKPPADIENKRLAAVHPVTCSTDLKNCNSVHREALKMTWREYEEIASSYTAAVSLPDIISMERSRIEYGISLTRSRGKPPASVLDVGCAGARDLETWMKNEIAYYGIDYSRNLLDIALERANTFGATSAFFKHANLIDMEVNPDAVSMVWCSSVIQHVPKDCVAGVLSKFYEVLEPGGVLYLNVRPPKDGVPVEGMVSSKEYTRTDGQKHVDRFVSHYELDEMRTFLKRVGFIIESHEVYSEVYHQYDDGGQKAAYLPEKFVIFARKPLGI